MMAIAATKGELAIAEAVTIFAKAGNSHYQNERCGAKALALAGRACTGCRGRKLKGFPCA